MAVCLSAIVATVLIGALRRGRDGVVAGAKSEARLDPGAADLAVYKDQLAEIDRDLARRIIGADEALRLRAEVGRRVLEADRARSADKRPDRTGRPWFTTALILAAVLPGALAAYWSVGAPGYPDMALQPRLAELDARIAGRPTQEAELMRLGKARDAGLDATLAAELSGITDPEALRQLFREHFEAGRLQAALRAQERLISVLGSASKANDHANLALAMVVEAAGYVSPEAEAQLREALRRDMGNELSRYLVGEMFLQGGRFDQAFRFWRPIAEAGDPGAPWVTSIRERIEAVAQLAGVNYALPEAAGSGPSGADMAAAAEMDPGERQAMIEGMVTQLSDRLAAEGGPVEDWGRLIQSLVVLERKAEAQGIYDMAKLRFAGRDAELSFLRLAAVEAGLTP